MFDKKPLTYLITKGNLTASNFEKESQKSLEVIAHAIKSKVSFVQIREKQISANQISDFVSKTIKLARDSDTKVLVNDRFDIALAENADGVHLTSNSIPACEVRSMVNRDFVVAVSTHSFETAMQAREDGANFVTFSPIFATPAKAKFWAPQGLHRLREVCGGLEEFPVIALGGINRSNFESVIESGAAGFAAIRFLNTEDGLRLIGSWEYR